MKLLPLLLALALIVSPAMASQEAEQRAAIEARFAADSRECAKRFVVNACVDEAKERRRVALNPVVAREQALAAQARRERALEQAKRVQQRQQQAGASEAQALSAPFKASEPRPVKPAAAKPRTVPDPVQRAADQRARMEAVEAQADHNRNRLAARQALLRQRQLDAKRNAQKLKPKGASQLPTPTAADIAALGASAASR